MNGIDMPARAAREKKARTEPRADNMAARFRARFEPLGGADDLRIPHRERLTDPPFTFDLDDDQSN